MPQTNRMNLRYPAGSDTPDVVRDMTNIAADLEAVLPRMLNLGLQAGVIGANDLKVSAGAGMTVNIAAGVALVPDQTDTYGALTPVVRALLNGLAVTAANGTNPRIDQVVMDADGNLSVLAGVATAGATLDNRTGAAAVPNGYLRLADILIPAASASISAGNIRDRRPWARGAYFVAQGNGAGDWSTTSAGMILTNNSMQVRSELSGAPVEIGFDFHYTTGGGYHTTQFNDGATVIEGKTYIKRPPNANFSMEHSGATVTQWDSPAAGSHLLAPYFGGNTNGVYVGNASVNKPRFWVREQVRPNANNGTT